MDKRLYWVWADMLSRCRNPRHKSFVNYGGRGITVCERWHTFQHFSEDMQGSFFAGGMLDRRDNDGPYSAENCYWATRQQQNSNRRNCIYVNDSGERITLKEACRRRGLPYRAIVKRVQDRGWPLDAALTIPVGTGKHAQKWKAA